MPKTTAHIEEQLSACVERRKHVKRLIRQDRYTPKDQEILKVFMTVEFLEKYYENILRPYREGAQWGYNRAWKRVPLKKVCIKNELSDDETDVLRLMYHITGDSTNLSEGLKEKVQRLLNIREYQFEKYAKKANSKRYRR